MFIWGLGIDLWTGLNPQPNLTLTSGALYMTEYFKLDFQPNLWDFDLEKKISFWIVKIMNNFCFLAKLQKSLKKFII